MIIKILPKWIFPFLPQGIRRGPLSESDCSSMRPKIEQFLFSMMGIYIFYYLNFVWSKGVSIVSRKV